MYAYWIPFSPSFSPNRGWVAGRVDVQARVSVCEWVSECVSVCVCCSHLFSFFTLAFVLVNDLSLVSRCFLFWKCVRFCFRFCCRVFLFVVCTCILCLLPCHTRCSFIDVLSCTSTGVSEINHLTCYCFCFYFSLCQHHVLRKGRTFLVTNEEHRKGLQGQTTEAATHRSKTNQTTVWKRWAGR